MAAPWESADPVVGGPAQPAPWEQRDRVVGAPPKRDIGGAEAFGRGVGSTFAEQGNVLALAASAPAVIGETIANLFRAKPSYEAQDAVFRTIVDPAKRAVDYYAINPNTEQMDGVSTGLNVAGRVGAMVPSMIASGGASGLQVPVRGTLPLLRAAASARQPVEAAKIVAQAAAPSAVRGAVVAQPSFAVPATVNRAQQLYEAGVDPATIAEASAANWAMNTVQGAAPASMAGGIPTRIASGVGINVPLGAAQRGIESQILGPENARVAQDPFGGAEMGTDAAIGGVMAALFGGRPVPRPGKPAGDVQPPADPVVPVNAGENLPIAEVIARQTGAPNLPTETNARAEALAEGDQQRADRRKDARAAFLPIIGRESEVYPQLADVPNSMDARVRQASAAVGETPESVAKSFDMAYSRGADNAPPNRGEQGSALPALGAEDIKIIADHTGIDPAEISGLGPNSQRKLLARAMEARQADERRPPMATSFTGGEDGQASAASRPNVPGERAPFTRSVQEDTTARAQATEGDVADINARGATPESRQASAQKAKMLDELDALREQKDRIETNPDFRELKRRADAGMLDEESQKLFNKVEGQRRKLAKTIFDLESKIYDTEAKSELGSKSSSGTSDRPFSTNDTGGLDFNTRDAEGKPVDAGARMFEERARQQADEVRQKSIDDLEAEWRAREELRKQREARQPKQEKAENRYANSERSDNAQRADDGTVTVDQDGFAMSDKGAPIWFKHQRDAGRWILSKGNKSPNQVWEIANHPSGEGFTARQTMVRDGGPGGGNKAPEGNVPARVDGQQPKGGDPSGEEGQRRQGQEGVLNADQPTARAEQPAQSEPPKESLQQMAARLEVERVERVASLERGLSEHGGVEAVSKRDPGYRILLSADTRGEYPYRVTSFRDGEPVGHREYRTISDAATEFNGFDIQPPRAAEPLKAEPPAQQQPPEESIKQKIAKNPFVQWLKSKGGVNSDAAADMVGEKGFGANQLAPGLFRKMGRDGSGRIVSGHGLDWLAARAVDDGWLPASALDDVDGGVQTMKDMIDMALSGKDVYRLGDEDAFMAAKRAEWDAKQEAEWGGLDEAAADPDFTAGFGRPMSADEADAFWKDVDNGDSQGNVEGQSVQAGGQDAQAAGRPVDGVGLREEGAGRSDQAQHNGPAQERADSEAGRNSDAAGRDAGSGSGPNATRPRSYVGGEDGAQARDDANTAWKELRQQSREQSATDDVLLGNGKYVSFDEAVRVAKDQIDNGGMRPAPAQVNIVLDIAMRDVDRVLDAAKRPDLTLKGESNADILAREEQQRRQQSEQSAKDNAPPPEDFSLTGSNRPADVGAAKGQQSILDEAAKVEQAVRGAPKMVVEDSGDAVYVQYGDVEIVVSKVEGEDVGRQKWQWSRTDGKGDSGTMFNKKDAIASAKRAAREAHEQSQGSKKGGTQLYANPIQPVLEWAGKHLGFDSGHLGRMVDDVRSLFEGKDAPDQNPIARAMRTIFYSIDGQMRSLEKIFNSSAIGDVRRLFNADPGQSNSVGGTYGEAVNQRTTSWRNRLYGALEPFSEKFGDDKAAAGLKRQDREQIARKLQNRALITGNTPMDNAAREIAKILDEVVDYMRAAGVNVEKIKDYFPRIIDITAVMRNPDGFKVAAERAYRDAGLSAQEAKDAAAAYTKQIMLGGSGVMENPFIDFSNSIPRSDFAKHRSLTKAADRILADFLIKDPEDVLDTYINKAVRRAEWERRLGGEVEYTNVDGKKVKGTKYDMMRDKVLQQSNNPAAVGYMDDLVRASVGEIPSSIGTMGRSVISWARSLTVIEFLRHAALTSVTEPLLAGARSNAPISGAAKAYIYSLQDIARRSSEWLGGKNSAIAKALTSKDTEVARRVSEMLGIVEHHLAASAAHVLQADGTMESSKIASRLATRATVLSGLRQWTDATRIASARVGMKFIEAMAAEASTGGKLAQRMMREMGIKDSDQQAFNSWLKAGGDIESKLKGNNPQMEEMYRTALGRFVDQVIMAPKNADKPYWANHPIGSVAYSLTGYLYAFQQNVLNRTGRLMVDAVKNPDGLSSAERAKLLAPLAYFIMAPVMQAAMVPVRDMIKGTSEEKRREKYKKTSKINIVGMSEIDTGIPSWMVEAVSRSGVTGAADPLLNLVTNAKYEKRPSSMLIGPYGQNVEALFTDTFGRNSKNTNTQERKVAEDFYRVVVDPAVSTLALRYLPGPAAMVVNQAMGMDRTRDAFKEAVAGPDQRKKKQSGTFVYQ